MLIEHGTLVLALDGGKMALYRNAGRGLGCDLELLCDQEKKLADTADLGSDQPGRSFSSTDARRSSVGQTDWHQQGEDRFTEESIRLLEEKARESNSRVIVIAPPKALGVARNHYGTALRKRIIAEIDRDYAARPADEISAMLVAA